MLLRPQLPLGRAPGLCGPGQPVPMQAHSHPRTPLTDRRLHLIKEKKRIKIEILLLFSSDKSAARNGSIVSQPRSSCCVFLSCFNIFLQLLVSPFSLLALIYSFSPEMGFINHCNAALGKMVLSAGRNTSLLTAPAGRQTLGLLLGSGDGLLMVFAFYVCARAIGAGPWGALRTPPL